MKKTLLPLLSAFISFASMAQFSGSGSGTDVDPYIITTSTHLDEVRNDLTAYYEVGNDIDLTFDTSDPSGTFFNGGEGWDPIDGFSGNFDGGGFSFDGLYMNRPTEDYVALFGNPYTPAVISNLNLIDADITGKVYVGGIAGWMNGSSNDNATIERCSVSGNITGDEMVGAIVGNNYYTNVIECFSTGTVSANTSRAGGLLGAHTGTTTSGLLNSYSFADVQAPEKVGLLVGDMNAASITNSYGVGALTGNVSFYPLYGASANSPITSSYWSGEEVCIAINSLSSLSNSEMTLQVSFTNWDFSSVWSIVEGQTYPYLQWEGGSSDYHVPPEPVITPVIAELPDRIASCEFTYDSQPSATDNCGKEIFATPTDSEGNHPFPMTEDGTIEVTWTFEDDFGNTLIQTQNFILQPDSDGPVPTLADLPDLEDECSVTVENAPTAEDACSGTSVGMADVEFPITTQGTTVITWTYEDAEGNATTQEQTVIIADVTDPIVNSATLETINVECEVAELTPPTATDNCLGIINGTTETQFPITALGSTVVMWTFTDDNGNSVSQEQTVNIGDTEAPVPTLEDLPVIYSNCDGIVTQIDPPTATDACSGAITATTNQVFPFTITVDTQILWEYDDGNGNTEIQFQDIVRVDNEEVSVDTTVCEGVSFTFPDGSAWDGELLTQISILQTQQGCDSTVTTNVTIAPLPDVDLGDDVAFGCVGEELAFGIDESSIDFETYTISTLFGNSSTDDSLKFTFNETIAATSSTQDVYVTIELTTTAGCVITDQVLLRNNALTNWAISVDPTNDPQITTSNTVLPETADSFEWDFGDGTTNSTEENPSHTYAENGSYTVTLTVFNECGQESLSADINISEVCSISDNTVTESNGTLTANAMGLSYQWIDCDTDLPISGETNQSFTPLSSGDYSVEISDGNCTIESSCITVVAIPLNVIDKVNVNIFPNPVSNILNIDGVKGHYSKASLINATGKRILDLDITSSAEFKISDLPSGVYFIQLSGKDSNELLRFIKR